MFLHSQLSVYTHTFPATCRYAPFIFLSRVNGSPEGSSSPEWTMFSTNVYQDYQSIDHFMPNSIFNLYFKMKFQECTPRKHIQKIDPFFFFSKRHFFLSFFSFSFSLSFSLSLSICANSLFKNSNVSAHDQSSE